MVLQTLKCEWNMYSAHSKAHRIYVNHTINDANIQRLWWNIAWVKIKQWIKSWIKLLSDGLHYIIKLLSDGPHYIILWTKNMHPKMFERHINRRPKQLSNDTHLTSMNLKTYQTHNFQKAKCQLSIFRLPTVDSFQAVTS